MFDFIIFALAQAFFLQVDELDGNLPFFKVAQGFFAIEALRRAEDLYVHKVSVSFRNILCIAAKQGQVVFLDVGKGPEGVVRQDVNGRGLLLRFIVQ